MRSNIIKFLALAACIVLFAECKSTQPTTPNANTASLLEVSKILDTTHSKFLEFANQTSGDPWKALLLTADWVAAQPTVSSAETLDSVYIVIVLRSGLHTTFYIDQVDADGHSLFRGGGGSHKDQPSLVATTRKSKNTIQNKNVLIFAAAANQFYSVAQMDALRNLLTNSSLGLKVKILQDEQCTYQTIEHFGDYGLVILDTHGAPDGFLVGNTIQIGAADSTETLLKQTISTQLSADGYAKLLSGELGVFASLSVNASNPLWLKSDVPYRKLIWVSSNYINELPALGNTVVFGNMCYSGWQVTTPGKNPAIQSTFLTKNPISYYGYSFDDGRAAPVANPFAQSMEDSLLRALLYDGDSTGIAHQKSDGSLYNDPYFKSRSHPNVKLWLMQNGPLDYSYGKCGDPFTDDRDGQVYPTVCLGNQVWMAKNLNYNAAGSLVYQNDPSNGDIYGRLYDWATAMQGDSSSVKTPSGVRGVCPKGWHLPSYPEWAAMLALFGDQHGQAIALEDTSLLWNPRNTGATNSSGFSVFPAGAKDFEGLGFVGIHTNAEFWTSTKYAGGNLPIGYSFDNKQPPTLNSYSMSETAAESCRCVKDP